MKLMHFIHNNQTLWGEWREAESLIYVLEGDIFGDFNISNKSVPFNEITLLPPAKPQIMVCCILNYLDKLKETGRWAFRQQSFFFKPPTSMAACNQVIKLLPEIQENHFEGELCIVLKKKCSCISKEEACDYILGFTCGIDLSAFSFYYKDGNLTRAKGFDNSGPLGPCLVTELDYRDLEIQSRVNGQVVQSSSTKNMLYTIPELISTISHFITLHPGDVIWTGSPSTGRGDICVNPGDVLEVEIENIGTLVNTLV